MKGDGGDPDQEYFADGIVEDIITALSRFRELFVIARNSSFTYKGRAVDVKQVGRELGVRYLLEGSVRKSANRVRITGQLIDASTGIHLWGDRFDAKFGDIFALQDDVTASVVGAIAPKLEQAEIDRTRRKPTENLDAYDYVLRGMACLHQFAREANEEALRLFHTAIELDPAYAAAFGAAARCYTQRVANGWITDREHEKAEAVRLARRAITLGKDDASALYMAAFALANVAGDLDTGATFIDRALALNPNLATAWHFSAWIRIWLGDPELALSHEMRAMRLSPLDPLKTQMQTAAAYAHFFSGRYDDALAWAVKAVREQQSGWIPAYGIIAASHALAGRLKAAQEAVAQLMEINPSIRLSHLQDHLPLRRKEDSMRLVEASRKAGFPE